MFILESTYDGAGTIVETGIIDNEAGAVGEVVKIASGKLTKCGADDTPAGVLIKATPSGTNLETEFIRVRRDQVWLADYTGTAPVVGAVYGIDSNALLIDTNNADGGNWEVVSVDTAKAKCRVIPVLETTTAST